MAKEESATRELGRLGYRAGVGLVVADMVGSGVFLSTGFMAQDMGPRTILLAWVVGMALAMCGAVAYARIALLVPRSGGEYRYLSELVHPALGHVAGYASMLLGFAGPVAINALALGAFAQTLFPGVSVHAVALLVIASITLLHAFHGRVSRVAQDGLVLLKIGTVIAFIVMALMFGRYAEPTWEPPNPTSGFPLAPFAASLFYINFAFSGWNAAAYAAGEFRDPGRDVARSMVVGCFAVGVLYLFLNWVFVTNLSPASASGVFAYEGKRITLAHVLVTDLLGPQAAALASVLLMIALLSAASAMTLLGPRVYAAMAADGYLPRALGAREGRVPTGSVLLQGGIAAAITLVQRFQDIIHDVGAVLTVFSLLTVSSVFWMRWTRPDLPRPGPGVLLAAGAYALLSLWMLYFGLRAQTDLSLWLGIVVALGLGAYLTSRLRHEGS